MLWLLALMLIAIALASPYLFSYKVAFVIAGACGLYAGIILAEIQNRKR